MLTADNYAEVTKTWYDNKESAESGLTFKKSTGADSSTALDADNHTENNLKIHADEGTGHLFMASDATKDNIVYDNAKEFSVAENDYKGALYFSTDGSEKQTKAWLTITAKAGDIITVAASDWSAEESGSSTTPVIAFFPEENNVADGVLTIPVDNADTVQTKEIKADGNSDSQKHVVDAEFTAKDEGTYVICAKSGNLVVARVTKAQADETAKTAVKVTGTVTFDKTDNAPTEEELSKLKLVFTEQTAVASPDVQPASESAVVEASITKQGDSYKYEVQSTSESEAPLLYQGSKYDITVKEDSATSEKYTVDAASAVLDLSAESSTEKTHDVKINVKAEVKSIPSQKLDVWDFGGGRIAEDSTKVTNNYFGQGEYSNYNNLLTEDVLNKVKVTGKTIGSFAVNKEGAHISSAIDATSGTITSFDGVDFCFNDGGYPTSHRLRTINDKITIRYDDKSYVLPDDELTGTNLGTAIASGGLYDNKGKNKDIYVGIRLAKGDILDAIVSSNGNAYTITVEDPEGNTKDYAKEKGVHAIRYYADKDGMYKIYNGTDEKMILGRIVVEHTAQVTVSGTVTVPEGVSDLSLIFTCNETGGNIEAPLTIEGTSGTYSVNLYDKHSYSIGLSNTDYIISTSSDTNVTINGEASITRDLMVEAVDTAILTGSIRGLEGNDIEALELSFVKPADKAYEPKISIDTAAGTYEAKIEKNTEYTIKLADKEGQRRINDYRLVDTEGNSEKAGPFTEDTTRDILLEKKPAYTVTIVPSGATLSELESSGAQVTFTNLGLRAGRADDAGYEYTFDIKAKPSSDEVIRLRNGVYSVKVTNTGNYVQDITSNLVVNNANVKKSVPFSVAKEVTEWDFSDSEFYTATDLSAGWKGLLLNNVKSNNNKYALMADGSTIQIPIKANEDSKITVTYCYQANTKFENEETPSICTVDGSTSTLHTAVYKYTAGSSLINAGYITLTHVTADIDKGDGTLVNAKNTYLTKIKIEQPTEYKDTLTVGQGADYDFETINEAIDAVRDMDREAEDGSTKPVTISIEPGDYEEMLVIDVDNVKLVNASEVVDPVTGLHFTDLKDGGVHINKNAVRITSYYGHGYNYFSMNSDYKWDEETLKTNLNNGYVSTENPGSGTATMWNATVVINASNVSAEGIIFENSFNQYVSKKASEDEIISTSAAKEGSVPRAELPEGSTAVQDKAYVERASALAIGNNAKEISFDNCRFVGRQDTLYGGNNVTAAFYRCYIYGGTDYIFGPMTAVFAKCELLFNTSEDKNDVGYITAAQTSSGHGFLMYNCHVTSTTPGVDTASEYTSKPGYFGRPWKAETSEALFYKTVVDAVDSHWLDAADSENKSLISQPGWLDTLSGRSALSAEYNTFEYAKGIDNSTKRADWATVHNKNPYTDDAAAVTAFLGEWNAFEGKDMAIVMPTDKDKVDVEYVAPPNSATYQLTKADWADKANDYIFSENETLGTSGYFTVVNKTVLPEGMDESKKLDKENSKDVYVKRKNENALEISKWGSGAIQFTVKGTANVTVEMASTGSGNTSNVGLITANGKVIDEKDGKTSVTTTNATTLTYEGLAAGTYQVATPYVNNENNNRAARVHSITVVEFESNVDTHTFEAADLIEFAKNSKEDHTSETYEKDEYFTLLYSSSSQMNASNAWEYSGADANTLPEYDKNAVTRNGRLRFGSGVSTDNNALKFTTKKPAKVTVYWAKSDKGREIAILDSNGNQVAITATAEVKNARFVSTLDLGKPDTYYLGNSTSDNYLFKVEVSESDDYAIEEPAVPRGEWDNVANPVLGEITLDPENPDAILVPVSADLSYDGGDEISVTMTGGEKPVSQSSDVKNVLNAIKFTTVAENAKVKVYWTKSEDGQLYIVDKAGMPVGETDTSVEVNTPAVSEIVLADAGDYYIGSKSGNNSIYKVTVTEDVVEYNADYDKDIVNTKEHVLDAAALEAADYTEKGSISADYFTVLYDAGSKVESSEASFAEGEDTYNATARILFADKLKVDSEYIFSFEPGVSGTYTFKPTLARKGKSVKKTGEEKSFDFDLSLKAPAIMSLTNLGKAEGSESGSVEIEWDSVKEATGYRIYVDDKLVQEITGAAAGTYKIEKDLTIGKKYKFGISAIKNETPAQEGADQVVVEGPKSERSKEITAEKEPEWKFATYGSSSSTERNGSEVLEDEEGNEVIHVWSKGGSGKIVPASTDGIAYYYTAVPTDKNFKLTAKVHVNEWTYSNGQDGFGLLASDRVGEHGDGDDFWTNSYMAVATKIEYHWDRENGKVDPASEDAVSLRLGLGSIEKIGVTEENLSEFETNTSKATQDYFKSTTDPLDTSIHKGTYNTIGNCVGGLGTIATIANPLNDFTLTIEKNNTGYFVSYTDPSGNTTVDKNYYPDALNMIDKDNVYIGLFAARNADVSFSEVLLTTTNVADDPGSEEKPVQTVTPDFSVTSGTTANNPDYDLTFSANWEGSVIIKDSMGKQIVPGSYTYTDENGDEKTEYVDGIVKDIVKTGADGKESYTQTYNPVKVKVNLDPGVNKYKVIFTPTTPDDYTLDKNGNKVFDYNPDPNPNYPEESPNRGFLELSNYAPQTINFSVTYKSYGKEGDALYVASKGSALGTGTRNNPLDIYTAVKYVKAGQTIYLMEGNYDLTKTVKIDRGIDGTENKRIYMMPDPEAKTRPVLDFGGKCEGLVLGGNYWYLKGFDVTGSLSGKDGVRVSGSNNILDNLETYMNGNTGIQISRMYGSDLWDNWPANNLILNCTSYLNTDSGYEDADGFAAKLTIADGNIFDGCIAHHNADDGWDLFAKVESGSIGTVTIRNCIAYKNGYVLTTDGKRFSPLAKDGIETDAGNGNGFKMGGSSLPAGREPSEDTNGDGVIDALDYSGHILQNSLAFYNKAKGIDSNSCPNIKIYNSVSYNNEGANVAFYTNKPQNTAYAAKGLISYRTDFLKVEDNLKLATGSKLENKDNKQSWTDLYDVNSYYWDTATAQSMVRKGDVNGKFDTSIKSVKKTWFESLDFDKYIQAARQSERKSDGTIDMHGFLVLTALANEEIGAIGEALPEEGALGDALPEVPENVPATDGNIIKGDAPDETEAKIPAQDAIDGEIPLGLWIAPLDNDEIVYTGQAIKPDIHVYYHETRLRAGKDYSVTYKNNIKAFVKGEYPETSGKKSLVPTITVKGKGNYKGVVTTTFDINPVPLNIDDAVSPAELVAASRISPDIVTVFKGKRPSIKVTYNNRGLTLNRDYTISPALSTVSSDTTVTITAKENGNYIGSREIKIYAVDKSQKEKLASSFKVDKIPDQQRSWAYSGNDKYGEPQPVELSDDILKVYAYNDRYKEHPLERGTDYEVSYRNNYEVGIATVIIKGIAPNYLGTKEVKFRIVAQPINSLISQQKLRIVDESKWPVISNYSFASHTYEGKAVELEDIGVAAYIGDSWQLLEKDLDYTVSYKNNNKAGKASVIIKGIGNYKGSITKNFTIAALNLSSTDPDVIRSIGGSFEREYRNGAWIYTESIETTYSKGGAVPDNVVLKIKDSDDTWNKLILGKDYTISYKNNKSVNGNSTPTIVIRGKGGLKGTLERPFTILRKDFNDSEAPVTLNVEDVGVGSSGGRYVPRFSLIDANGKKLSAGSDFDKKNISYIEVDENGNPVKELGKNERVKVNEGSVKYIQMTVRALEENPKCNYTGELTAIYRVVFSRQLIKGARVTINYGTEYVLRNGEIVMKDGKPVTRKKTFFNFDPENSIIFTQPETQLTVKIGSGSSAKTLVYGTDFEFVRGTDGRPLYVKNAARGTASVTICGKGKYAGTKIVTFRIGSRDWNLDAIEAEASTN